MDGLNCWELIPVKFLYYLTIGIEEYWYLFKLREVGSNKGLNV